jgi:hypothetical protein
MLYQIYISSKIVNFSVRNNPKKYFDINQIHIFTLFFEI